MAKTRISLDDVETIALEALVRAGTEDTGCLLYTSDAADE